jgi:tRNA-specific 2-thiouridylase
MSDYVKLLFIHRSSIVNPSFMRILVGLSGGVDSAVTALLLKQQGHDVSAGFMINYHTDDPECSTKKDLAVAREVAQFLGISFHVFDYEKEYRERVEASIYDGYLKGITPNPDILCNSEIKFKLFLEESIQYGFDAIATGHYARIRVIENGGYDLLKGVDPEKDQSYFLAGLNQAQLARALFPIGSLHKTEVRKIALDAGLPNANRKDSQGICFIGKVDMATFLARKLPRKQGDIIDMMGRVVGQHEGAWFYTIGQRRGIKVGGGPALFVVRTDVEKNQVMVGPEEDLGLFHSRLRTHDWHWINQEIGFPFSACAKIRYRQRDQEVVIEQDQHGSGIRAIFPTPQRAITPGQTIAVYRDDVLVGSGIIRESL